MKVKLTRTFLVLFLIVVFCGINMFDVQEYFSLEYIKKNLDNFRIFYEQHTLLTIAVFMVAYTLCAALSIPGATIFSLLAGALFGRLLGMVLASFATTIGGTLAFLSARFLLRNFVQARFARRLDRVNRGIKKEGWMYLLVLRLVPVFPYFVVNLVMGVTSMGVITFIFISQIGMLGGTFVYVNTGVELSRINSLEDIFSFPILASLSLLALFPFCVRKFFEWRRWRKLSFRYRSKKPRHYDYNIAVIGGGSAGLVTSYAGSTLKAKVALIEKGLMGGDCLNTGCVPSKALIKAAKVAHLARSGSKYGLLNQRVQVDFSQVMERVKGAVKKIAPHDSVERYTELGVDCFHGEAKIISPWEVLVGEKSITARSIIIATGGEPMIPSISGLHRVDFLTSDNFWKLSKLPQRLVVLGGGAIGLELAQSLQRFGSQVTVIEKSDFLLAKEDREIGELIKSCLEREGVEVLTSYQAIEVKEREVLCRSLDGKNISREFDQLLVAVGRKARTSGLGLEELGVEMDASGSILVNRLMKTNFPNIYACGDVVSGSYGFTHTASHQAWYCAANSLLGFIKNFPVNDSAIPRVTYTDPEVATVGETEQELKAKGVPYEMVEYNFRELDRAIVDGEERGFVKVLLSPGKDRILGAAIVGEGASSSIMEFVLGMRHGFGLKKILSTIHPYPSMVEANKYVAGKWRHRHRPKRVLEALKIFFKYARG